MRDIPTPTHANILLANALDAVVHPPGHGVDAVAAANKRLKITERLLGHVPTVTSEDVAKEEIYKHKLINRHVNGGTDAPNGAATAIDVENIVAAAITAACEPGGAITRAIAAACEPGGAVTNAIAAACEPGGAVTNAIAAACEPGGAVTNAVDASIETSNSFMKAWTKNQTARRANISKIVSTPLAERGPNTGNSPPGPVGSLMVSKSKADISRFTHADLNTVHDFYNEPSFAPQHTLPARRNALKTFLFVSV